MNKSEKKLSVSVQQSRSRTQKPSTPKKRPPGVKQCEHDDHKQRKLTFKQREWLALYMDTENLGTFGNASASAAIAYGIDTAKDRQTANQLGWENTRRLKLEIEDLLDEAGLTDVYLMTKLIENLNATKLYGQNAEEHMDGPARNKALEMAFKLRGRLTDKVDLTSKGKQIKGSVTIVKLPDNGRGK